MRYGFVLPEGNARDAAELAAVAEVAGWDGFFVWEPVWGVDAWVALAAAAMRTERIRLGTLLSPLSRMRPWDFAAKAATLDDLSGGRLIVSVGLGAPDSGFAALGEETDRVARAELLDEALDIVTGLWRGQPFAYRGKHYTIEPFDRIVAPPPVQQPRIPIWVVGAWPRPKSMARALRYDGLLPYPMAADGSGHENSPDLVHEMTAYVATHRTGAGPYDIVVEGEDTPGDDPARAAAIVHPWAEAGGTWWIESRWSARGTPGGLDVVRERLAQGPPRID